LGYGPEPGRQRTQPGLPVYWGKYDTPQLEEMGRKFARRNPLQTGDFFACAQNGATT
jgi:hypothetical protein